MASDKSLTELLAELDKKNQEIQDLMEQVQGMIKKEGARAKVHSKRVIKEGMSAYFEGVRKNPYKKGTDENEWWEYGFSISKDNWEEMKK